MAVSDRLRALASRVGADVKALRTGKADLAVVARKAATETISGAWTFGTPPQVPVGNLLMHPVRRDDARLTDARAWALFAGSPARGQAPVWDGTRFVPGQVGLSGVVDVRTSGARGDGITDDTAAIQAAIDGSPAGGVVWFPPGTYLVSSTIRLAPARAYVGAGGRALLTRIKAAPGLTGGAVLAARGWWDNGRLCDNPIRVEGLLVDGSDVVGVSGLVVYNFWSHVEDVQVGNIAGPDASGILATDRGRDGTTITENSHSENTFVRCRFFDHSGRATGFKVETHTSPVRGEGANQDGHLLDSFFASISGDAIRMARAAGWSIENNHLYGIGYNGIALGNCYATKVLRNYVEDFGGADGENNGAAPTYGYFNGIAMETVLDTRASVIADNTVSTSQPSSPAGERWTCYSVRAGWGQKFANVVVEGNTAVFVGTSAPATPRSWAYRLGEGGDASSGVEGRLLQVEWAGNQIQGVGWWQGARYVHDATVQLTDSGTAIVRRELAADWTLGAPTGAFRTRFELLAAGGARTVTVPAAVRLSTGLTSRTFSVPSGQVWIGLLEWSSLANAYVLAAATVSTP